MEPFTFTAATRKDLADWLDPRAIDRLQAFVETARQIERDRNNEPTMGESRAVLERIADLAEALATAISKAPTAAEAELCLVGHQRFRDLHKAPAMAREVRLLSLGVRERLEVLPAQSRRGSHSFLVSGIAEVAESSGIKVSDAPSGDFAKICGAVFQALDIEGDPRGSIRAYLAGSQKGG